MKLHEKINSQERIIKEMNTMIDNIIEGKNINEQNPATIARGVWELGKQVVKSPVGRYLLRKAGSDIEKDVDDDKVDTKDIKKTDIVTPDDVEKVLDNNDSTEKDTKKDTKTDGSAFTDLEKELEDLAKRQLELLQKYKKGYGKIKISFNSPLEFKLKRGDDKGEELRLEKTKVYDIYEISQKKDEFNPNGEYKILFTYKGWLRDYGIMFSILQKELIKNSRKKGDNQVDIVYVEKNRGGSYRIIDEQVLTKRAVIEIEDLK
jgi:hypothetical protein